MKKTILIPASVFAMITLTLTIAASTLSASGKTENSVTLRAVTSFTGDDPWKATWEEVIQAYRAKHPNVTIVNEATPTAGEALRTKIKTDFASGNEPDVSFFFTGVDTKPLLESGKLYQWDSELRQDAAWGRNFVPSALKAVAYGGKIYALPYIGYYEGLLVNMDLFRKYHVQVPRTYNELVAAIKTFNQHGITPIANSFVDPRYLVEFSILSAGGPKGHANPFDPSWETGLNAIKDLYRLGAFPKDCMTLTDEQAQQLFKDKKAAMIVNGSWVVGGCKDQINTRITYFPSVRNARGNYRDIIAGCGSGWYMSKPLNDQKKGAPLAFIKYLTSPAVMAKFVAVSGVPQIKTTLPAITPAKKSGWDMESSASSLNVPIDYFLNADAFNRMNSGVAYIISGQMTAKQVLAEAKKLNK